MRAIFLSLFCLTIFACKKHKDDFRTVKGQILNITDSSAFANRKFSIGGSGSSGALYNQTEDRYLVSFMTDNTGSFSVSYNANKGVYPSIYWGTFMGWQSLVAHLHLESDDINDVGKLYTKQP